MDNLQLLLKMVPGGAHLLSADPSLLSGEVEPLSLKLFSTDPLFFNYTDLGREIRPQEEVLFFSNHGKNLGKDTLYSTAFASAKGSLRVINQGVLRGLLPALAAKEFSLYDESDTALGSQDASRLLASSGEAIFYAEKEGKREGLYHTGKAMDRPPTGVISLMPDLLHQSYTSQNHPVTFSVCFKSRKTVWKYILSDKSLDKFSNLAVVDAYNREVRFKEGEFEIQPSWKVRSFESEELLPFTNEISRRFQLIESPNDSTRAGKVLFKQLPKAKPEHLYQQLSNNQIVYSHIFI